MSKKSDDPAKNLPETFPEIIEQLSKARTPPKEKEALNKKARNLWRESQIKNSSLQSELYVLQKSIPILCPKCHHKMDDIPSSPSRFFCSNPRCSARGLVIVTGLEKGFTYSKYCPCCGEDFNLTRGEESDQRTCYTTKCPIDFIQLKKKKVEGEKDLPLDHKNPNKNKQLRMRFRLILIKKKKECSF